MWMVSMRSLIEDSRALYNELRTTRPDLLPLLNKAFYEIYTVGKSDGYHTGPDYNSGIFATLGGLRWHSNYELVFPEANTDVGAHARLVDAAPALLEGCETALGYEYLLPSSVVALLRNAITRATGYENL